MTSTADRDVHALASVVPTEVGLVPGRVHGAVARAHDRLPWR